MPINTWDDLAKAERDVMVRFNSAKADLNTQMRIDMKKERDVRVREFILNKYQKKAEDLLNEFQVEFEILREIKQSLVADVKNNVSGE